MRHIFRNSIVGQPLSEQFKGWRACTWVVLGVSNSENQWTLIESVVKTNLEILLINSIQMELDYSLLDQYEDEGYETHTVQADQDKLLVIILIHHAAFQDSVLFVIHPFYNQRSINLSGNKKENGDLERVISRRKFCSFSADKITILFVSLMGNQFGSQLSSVLFFSLMFIFVEAPTWTIQL